MLHHMARWFYILIVWCTYVQDDFVHNIVAGFKNCSFETLDHDLSLSFEIEGSEKAIRGR
jgi:hypothetical protein